MSDENALLAAIVGQPDEDTPRLMYADWLDENDQPERAEFIRSQIERVHVDRGDPRWRVMLGREAELLVAAKRTWLRPYLLWTDLQQLTVRRGLVERAEAYATALAPHVDTFRQLTALLELHVLGYGYHNVPTEEEPPNAPLPPRRGWLGAALRKIVAVVRSDGLPQHLGYLCRIALATRPPGLRVRAPLGSKGFGGVSGTLFLDLLDPEADEPDAALRADTWTVLVWRPDVPDEWRLVGRLARALCLHTQTAPLEFFRLKVAARPVRAPDELTAWGVASLTGGPHWLRFHDGELTESFLGFGPPTDWLGGVSM